MNLLATRRSRRLLFASLYMSEGAPIGFLWWALPTILRSSGVPLDAITVLISLLALPWALKFLWAPLIDILRHRWPLKSWILLSQTVMGLSLFPLFLLEFQDHFLALGMFLILHSFAAATQDVSIDALCIRSAPPDERGSLNGWMQAGMLSSRALLGGGALIVVDHIGLGGVVALLIALIWSSSLLLFFTSAPGHASSHETPSFSVFRKSLRAVLAQRSTWYGLLFAAIAGAAYESVGAVGGPFLLEQGFNKETVGWFFLIPAVASTIGGSLLGGIAADRFNRTNVVRTFLVMMALSVWALSGIKASGPDSTEIYLVSLSVIYFMIGLFVASTYALFMDWTVPELGATQFSAYMGATNLCESWSAFAVGRMIGGWGYAGAFLVMGFVSISSLCVLSRISRQSVPGGSFQPVQ